MIKVEGLRKAYPGSSEPAVDGVSITVEEGAFYTLLGPSGCGKTTTLRCIAGLERADSGTIQLGGTVVQSERGTVPTHRRDIGMVFQSYAVWPHMTVFENAAFPLRVAARRLPAKELRDRVEHALDLVGLGGLEDRMAPHLSGGQQQRLSLARAIVREPSVLLLDEPLSNLDAKLRERMRAELLEIQRRLAITTLFVTHDQIEALSMSDRIAVMRHGQVVQEGTPREIYHHPANPFVSGFIGSTNLLTGSVDAPAGGGAGTGGTVRVRTGVGSVEVPTGGAWQAGDAVLLAVRPEDVVLHRKDRHAQMNHQGAMPEGNTYPAVVRLGLFTGRSVTYQLEVGGTVVQAQVASRIHLERGDQVHVELPPDACQVFADAGPDGDDAADDGQPIDPGDPGATVAAGLRAG